MAKLVINPTSASKKEIPIDSRVISIGRDPSNDLVLSDSMVSRRHAILEQRNDEFVLRDNNSSNGTMVNGDRVESEKTLRDGDLVAIGSSRLLFRLDEKAEESSALHLSAPSLSNEAKPSGERLCPSCGEMVFRMDRFCRACGKELANGRGLAVCRSCGADVYLPAEYCGRCGTALGKKKQKDPLPATRTPKPDLGSPGSRSDGSHAPGGPLDRSRHPEPRRHPYRGTPRATEPAGFGIRLVATLVDGMILGVPLMVGALVWGTFALGGSPSMAVRNASPAGIGFLTFGFFALCVAYFVYFWGARGATPGKSLLGLVVETESGQSPIGFGRASLRVMGYLVSLLPLGIGYLWILFSDERLGLHDRIAGTRVTRSS